MRLRHSIPRQIYFFLRKLHRVLTGTFIHLIDETFTLTQNFCTNSLSHLGIIGFDLIGHDPVVRVNDRIGNSIPECLLVKQCWL